MFYRGEIEGYRMIQKVCTDTGILYVEIYLREEVQGADEFRMVINQGLDNGKGTSFIMILPKDCRKNDSQAA
jgi:hypothetical protein